MRPLQIQLVWANPRTDSLTATIAKDLGETLAELGAHVDELDLYRSGFDSVLREPDEPAWDNPHQQYSPEVQTHAVRAMNAAAIVFVFPVWWYSLPALLKGYIDRVWNYGLFYGGETTHEVRAIRWIGLAGHPREEFSKRGYDQMMDRHLNLGIADYCGVADSRLQLLHNTLGAGISDLSKHVDDLRATAKTTAVDLMARLTAQQEFSSESR